MSEAEIKEKFTVGGTVRFEIVSIEPAEHRLGLKLEGVKGKTSSKPEDKEKKEKNEKKIEKTQKEDTAEMEGVEEDEPASAKAAADEEEKG
jgi:hypothetical protein